MIQEKPCTAIDCLRPDAVHATLPSTPFRTYSAVIPGGAHLLCSLVRLYDNSNLCCFLYIKMTKLKTYMNFLLPTGKPKNKEEFYRRNVRRSGENSSSSSGSSPVQSAVTSCAESSLINIPPVPQLAANIHPGCSRLRPTMGILSAV